MALDTTVGGASTDSYITLAEYQAYATARDWTLTGPDARDEARLRRAAQAIDAMYLWIGHKATQAQARQWPRIYSGLIDGYPLSSSTVPQAIKDAQAELAFLIQEGLDPFATVEGLTRREKVKAAVVEVEVEYASGKTTPHLVGIDALLLPYIVGSLFGGAKSGPIRP